MGKRHRQREKLTAPTSDYRDAEGSVLKLRGAMTPATRREYAAVLAGSASNAFGVGAQREDAWQRAVEFLFERLAVEWEIAGVATTRQKDLLARFRLASADERRFVRDALREHLAENFPDLEAP
ncbi:MAG TPA: hypothetical protein VG275_03620 [Solirubrobacteraceae bacterium]|nr:hypothetical protein [Solirubrobacteraceae bacterium]